MDFYVFPHLRQFEIVLFKEGKISEIFSWDEKWINEIILHTLAQWVKELLKRKQPDMLDRSDSNKYCKCEILSDLPLITAPARSVYDPEILDLA